uniref:Uncharacterized protein n=1 Tax=Emiliania huxleyi (strain CCMP1516) TaxID=280463 RepID=A0A0D3J6S5_EMIH1
MRIGKHGRLRAPRTHPLHGRARLRAPRSRPHLVRRSQLPPCRDHRSAVRTLPAPAARASLADAAARAGRRLHSRRRRSRRGRHNLPSNAPHDARVPSRRGRLLDRHAVHRRRRAHASHLARHRPIHVLPLHSPALRTSRATRPPARALPAHAPVRRGRHLHLHNLLRRPRRLHHPRPSHFASADGQPLLWSGRRRGQHVARARGPHRLRSGGEFGRGAAAAAAAVAAAVAAEGLERPLTDHVELVRAWRRGCVEDQLGRVEVFRSKGDAPGAGEGDVEGGDVEAGAVEAGSPAAPHLGASRLISGGRGGRCRSCSPATARPPPHDAPPAPHAPGVCSWRGRPCSQEGC